MCCLNWRSSSFTTLHHKRIIGSLWWTVTPFRRFFNLALVGHLSSPTLLNSSSKSWLSNRKYSTSRQYVVPKDLHNMWFSHSHRIAHCKRHWFMRLRISFADVLDFAIWESFFFCDGLRGSQKDDEEVVSETCKNSSVSLLPANSSYQKVRSSRPCVGRFPLGLDDLT